MIPKLSVVFGRVRQRVQGACLNEGLRPGAEPARRSSRMWMASLVLGCATFHGAIAKADEPIESSIAVIKRIGPEGAGYEEATLAAQMLSSLKPDAVGTVLVAMKDTGPLAKNWLRMIANDIADNGPFPRQVLLSFFEDRSQDADARHAAYQMLVTDSPEMKTALLTGAFDDPSLPIRHLAIAELLAAADGLKDSDKTGAEAIYRRVVENGRNPDQLQAAVKSLESLGQKVVLADELGLVRRWWAIGTYDNTGSAHFNTAYAPEQTFVSKGVLPEAWLRADAEVTPATGDRPAAKTSLVTSDDFQGVVSINPTFDNAKDAVAYVYAEFDVPSQSAGAPIDAVARLGCITASKVWVNGELAMQNEVYHSGSRIDQYLGDCKLKPGRNAVLIKVCQNAQTEPWAQDWQFQFRFTDPAGAAIKINLLEPKSI